ncbi:MAG TPA: sigma-70 family RNA polymerase sigma factor [Thermoanaerobaculia bacterium]|nr:sigma-70 family RNA polymerase sigma factor [Thermoanaerobaculia bacterium]
MTPSPIAGSQSGAGLPALPATLPELRHVRTLGATPERERQARRDARLMAEVKQGDAHAFEQIVDGHKDSLVNYLSRLTRCRDRAEEYAQEAFVRLYQNADRYDERGLLAAYLFRVATNLVRTDERRRKRWRLLVPFIERDDRSREPSPQREVLHEEASNVVAEAIAQLPLHFRAPLVMREIEGWSYQEIAEALGCRIGTVKSRINRAKAQLRERLERYWQGEGR